MIASNEWAYRQWQVFIEETEAVATWHNWRASVGATSFDKSHSDGNGLYIQENSKLYREMRRREQRNRTQHN